MKEGVFHMLGWVIAISALLLVFSVCLIVSEYRHGPRERYIYKTLASLMFVALGAIGLYLHHWEALPIVLGLLFSFGGDGFLALYDHKKHNYDFYLGIATFCLAQIAYSWHALEGGYTMWEPLLLAIGLTVLAAVGIHLFQMKLRGGFLAAILVYSLLLTFAFSAALFRYFKDPGPATLLLAVGKALFLASDVFLLFKYFYSRPHRHLTAWNLSTYYVAQLLLCLSITAV